MSLESKIAILQERAKMLSRVRSFFSERNVLEVDCPALSRLASVDAHIDLIPATLFGNQAAYLFSSPEYAMKRLLADGIGDIYQLSHVFRDGESGHKHNPEFMMAEWYRIGMSFEKMMEETVDFVRLFLGDIPAEVISYKEAFIRYVNINPYTASDEELRKLSPRDGDRDDLLNYILALYVEPHLGKGRATVLAYYPPAQAALAKTRVVDGEVVAERFEVYVDGVELANGYHELQDAKEQLRRLEEANMLRKEMGKNALPIDKHFIKALEKGLPECSGVAVGFDRLMMLRCKKKSLEEVMPFTWQSV
jgi:elongation factor P--(R)-beta-lysine ligase